MSSPLSMALLAILAAASLLALHRRALMAEDRGWIYSCRRKPSRSALGNAFLEVQSLFEPEKGRLVEVRKEQAVDEDELSEPPDVGKN